ncbi:MAG TPA: tetratricopeptide repeat protein [Candidatus Methanomethylophilaceae archaeon]|nr:tetratricopeptide repeat protein [Candidatus Methanomethylophilaceae archaeon]
MAVPEGHIEVHHGNLTVNVPRNIFKKGTGEIVSERAAPFREMIMNRYPWLTQNSMDVLMDRASKEMSQILDGETTGRSASKKLADDGRTQAAITHLEKALELDPDDADSWYLLGELLCSVGRMEEGYKAFSKGRRKF